MQVVYSQSISSIIQIYFPNKSSFRSISNISLLYTLSNAFLKCHLILNDFCRLWISLGLIQRSRGRSHYFGLLDDKKHLQIPI